MSDAGGRQSERRKWMHCFENVTVILFLIALSGYDKTLLEDNEANQMKDALSRLIRSWNRLGLSMCVLSCFSTRLIYSKKNWPVHPCAFTFQTCLSYFTTRFLQLNKTPDLKVYSHYTCATDSTMMKVVMESVDNTILKLNIHSSLV
ncbi:hypothetical protein CROQUDRAFT_175585 [Cronartium quercuum f. sp. fusiforme G11]|uniref:Uncharacterized protein n=1 Tax=Cronartium quercuum f. sp. fusiforme G11 TaxID=708437 RepID=A0A9P6NUC9_9BASI|nr:hypothetical protein CROQUDRAFT_175585 [Cronartium quercuum f. sp. fusiforme G11]